MTFSFPLILDGATGTELIKRGYDGELSSEEWTLLHPEAIQDIQRGYIDAGSMIVYSPTFGANRIKLAARGRADSVTDFNKRLAALSKEVAEGKAYVAGDLAPTGASVPPMGDTPFSEIYDTYLEQAKALDEAGVDLFVIETISSVADARAAILAVRSFSSKPVMVSFTCDSSGRTFTGADAAAALVTLQSMGADIFGLNCSYGPDDMVPQLRRISEYADVPLLAKPNAGVPENVDGKTVYNCPPEQFVKHVPEMAECGVMVFGGCCGTDDSHIRALREAVSKVELHPHTSAHRDELVLSTERAVFVLDRDTKPDCLIPCTEDLEDDISDFEDAELIGIDLDEEHDIEALEESQWSFQNPICFRCSDPEVLESALRVFQGRAAYIGNIPANELSVLSARYGLVVL